LKHRVFNIVVLGYEVQGMESTLEQTLTRPTHKWLKELSVAFVPGETSSVLEQAVDGLLRHFELHGHAVLSEPHGRTDILLTTARFGEPIPWRKALFFTGRRQYGLQNNPTIYTLLHLTTTQYEGALQHFQSALEKQPPDPADFEFPGLAPQAYRVLLEQSRRAGPILALLRQVQAQTKSIRILMIVGDDRPVLAHHFDLVGAYPKIDMRNGNSQYEDLVLRIVTAMSTEEITDHQVAGDSISNSEWMGLSAPAAMLAAGTEFGRRNFFTEMVRISDLVQVPAVSEGVASQYSEGCFATWEPAIDALITTVTGSARPVEKDAIEYDDLAVIVGVRPNGKGALVRHVEGRRNDPPSSEAVELMDMDSLLPTIELGGGWPLQARVPVVRSKLHGHRSVTSFDPSLAEHVMLDEPYYHYPVSCATGAQAEGIKVAFSRSKALQNPEDPRQLVFTILPGHGVVVAEKWLPGKAPFQAIWEAMDSEILEVDSQVPQGVLRYEPDAAGRMVLHER
jgi:hypothetical protein